eukprot:TRINITY_DN19568_c0_g1_i1.p1 TRINITY_DN19568_c0_g1~~TRINITY_DN19568_c0_g1_i1.p1  ORF type:complete len:308 (+),score=85.18 TRINITY_DN19568_c0_g1_i1:122-1045(+)
MKKYGLQLRVPPSQQKKKQQQSNRPPLPLPLPGFQDDEDDVESEIARHAIKNKSLRDIEEQHKKALEEDPSVFDYDGVYEEMKEKIAQPLAKDRHERKSKYIQTLMEKAKVREREHEIIYEKKLAKERSKDDHLFVDKEKFVTSAYKQKLAEQEKWLADERLRQLREEREDVTKKSDMSDFYFNLTKNVAFGAKLDSRKPKKQEAVEAADTPETESLPETHTDRRTANSVEEKDSDHFEAVIRSQTDTEPSDAKLASDNSLQENAVTEVTEPPPLADQTAQARHKRSEDAVAAAKERFLARKRAKEQ